MGLMDKVKAQATQVAQKAQEAAQAGQSKLEGAQSKKQADALLRELGLAVYAQHKDGTDQGSAEVDRLLSEISSFEAQNGPIDGHAEPESATSPLGAESEDPDAPMEDAESGGGDFQEPASPAADVGSSSFQSEP